MSIDSFPARWPSKPLCLGLAWLAVPFAAASPAGGAEGRFELWLNPSVSTKLDGATTIVLETAQQFRPEPADDTFYGRAWLGRRLAEDVTLRLGLERRSEGSGRETRLLQQLSYPLGPVSARTRLEQRFIGGQPRTGWRLRQRIGASVPLSGRSSWALAATVEGFYTLRATARDSDTGLTGVRTFLGVERDWESVELSLGYLRQQSIRRGAADTVARAPFIGMDFKL